ncbi:MULTISPECIES: hypothetical protein [unclassified Streptomyces]|uniref:hypothetical protein n=1 Tax=unclassified Streptomyces TaxID=2593676 RepID=UPI00332F63A5
MTDPQRAIASFLDELHRRGYKFGTRRLRGHYLTEYLEHVLGTLPTAEERAALTSETLMDLEHADAWLTAGDAGKLRQRNTLRGPHATSAEASHRSRVITYNVFAAHLGTPWRLEVPRNAGGDYLDPDEADAIIHTLSVRRPPTANEPTWIRTAALAALVAATGRTVRELAELDVSNLQFKERPARIVFEDGPEELDDGTARTVRRWLRQRTGLITRLREEGRFTGTDPGYLWIPTKEVGHPGRPEETPLPLPARRASVRTLHAAHRRLVLNVLGHPVRLNELRVGDAPAQ